MTDTLAKKLTSCLVDQLYQIECADEDQINEDFSVCLMELVGAELQALDSDSLSELVELVSEMIESEPDEDRKIYLENFVENFGLDGGMT